jgi:hypothetical protein
MQFYRLLKEAHLLRCPHSSSLRRTSMYASFLGVSGALYVDLFEQPLKNEFFRMLLICFSKSFFISRDASGDDSLK